MIFFPVFSQQGQGQEVRATQWSLCWWLGGGCGLTNLRAAEFHPSLSHSCGFSRKSRELGRHTDWGTEPWWNAYCASKLGDDPRCPCNSEIIRILKSWKLWEDNQVILCMLHHVEPLVRKDDFPYIMSLKLSNVCQILKWRNISIKSNLSITI